MSLMRFHQALIISGGLFALFLAYWEFSLFLKTNSYENLAIAIASTLVLIILVIYFIYITRFINKHNK